MSWINTCWTWGCYWNCSWRKADSNWVFFKENIVAWRTENICCIELIPAELETSAETVYHLKADSTWVFFKESIVAWRTENMWCVELIPAELEASVETVEPLLSETDETVVIAGLGIVSCGRPSMCGPRKVIDVVNIQWKLN